MKPLIAYYRVSTQRQGVDGLGMDAQRNACQNYAHAAGGLLQAEYCEVESGRKVDRPQLALAIAHAKRIKGKLLIARLDRLGRNLAFVSRLMESGIDFVAVDNPNANTLTIHILAAMAEWEAKQISERTVAALAQAKKRGTLLGSHRIGHWDGREKLRRIGLDKAHQENRRLATARNAPFVADMRQYRSRGLSFARIAKRLNDDNRFAPSGSYWTAQTVYQVLKRQ